MEVDFDNVSLIVNAGTQLEKTILHNITFNISGPGIYSFVGASNSGKSAIGDLINAQLYPTTGKVCIGSYINDGRKIRNVRSLRLKMGYVFRNPYDMFFNKTIKDELEFSMKYFKYKTKNKQMRSLDALKLVGLDESYLKLDPHILSLSDAKKLALACVLIYNPKIIILDEFTNGLNSEDKKELLTLLRMLKNKYDRMIILLTKDTNYAYQISDTIYLMYKTRLVCKGAKEVLRDTELLEKINLEIPQIVDFTNICNKKGHDITQYLDIKDLIKGVYRDVF